MANEDKKDFNAMLHDSKDMPKFQTITDQKSIEKYGGSRMYFAPPIDYDKRRVLIIFIFFCKPCKINGLQAFSTLEIVIFLRFDTNLTPIFSFMVSEVHCHTIQLCYLVFNPCSVAQVVIHFHSHIKMSVSHDVL